MRERFLTCRTVSPQILNATTDIPGSHICPAVHLLSLLEGR
jgi:hypothetical protein